MPDPPYDESVFEDTKMTFGEHLEELRYALFKALAAIVLGFLLGLLFGKPLVGTVTRPLEKALERYHSDQRVPAFCDEFRQKQAAGEPLPEELRDIQAWDSTDAHKRVNAWLQQQTHFPDEVYIKRSDFLAAVHAMYPGRFPEDPAGDTSDSAAAPQSTPPPTLENSPDEKVPFTLWRPRENDPRFSIQTLNVQEGFMIYVKVALVAGVILASPFVFWAIWSFVAAGLYPHERSYVHVFLPISLGLFLAGVALAYFGVIRFVLDFLLSFNAWLGFDPGPRISEWLNFVLFLPLGFGVAFQLPLVMLFLERIGIVTVEGYLEKWRIAIMVIAILSMILTPADPMSMIFLGVPLTLLYFGGIGLCRFMPKNRSPFADALE